MDSAQQAVNAAAETLKNREDVEAALTAANKSVEEAEDKLVDACDWLSREQWRARKP